MPDTGAPWNIPYVAGTDLVSDWPTDSQTIAEAVADGLDIAGGYVPLATTTVSAVASLTIDDVFSSDYRNYLVYSSLTGSASGFVTLVFRAAGSDITTSNYNNQNLQLNGTTVAAARGTSTSTYIGGVYSTTYQTCVIWISRPNEATRTGGWRFPTQDGGANISANGLGPFDIDLVTQFDGFKITPSTGTITGTVTVYGMREV